uniref:Uncharacterized protein n=1 Tax=Tanacetum cinerariifolium TaxID=118510 RepID=A0A6L2L1S7_TANCI|nr:hypothetical protein [Tanacetum cinerariifolium]
MAQNIDFSGSDHIQTPQYLDFHPPSQETSEEDSNELFQKFLEDLKELAEYNNSLSKDRPIFLNDNEEHSVQNEESLENSSNEIDASNSNQEQEEPPQDFDIHQLIEECSIKSFYCIHDNVDDLIESALNSKLLLINSNSQRLDKEEQEVKNIVEQPAEHGNRNTQSLQNFRVIHKSSISLNNTSQISPVHAIAPILSTKEPEHSLSMGYDHLSITLETESDEVTESSAKNLLPIPSECEVTSEDESKCDVPIQDQSCSIFTTFSNPLFKDNDDLDSSDDESLPDEDVLAEEFKVYSNPLFDEDEINSDKLDPYCFNVESDFIESLLNLQDGDSQREEIDIVIETDDVLPSSVENDDDSSNDPLLEEADLFLASDNSIPSGIESSADDPEGDIRFWKNYLSMIPFFLMSHLILILRINRREINVSTKIEDDDYFPFMFVIRFFLQYLIFPEVSPLFLSAESEDTIFDPGFTPSVIEVFLCWIFVPVSKIFTSFL